jgi:plasmid stabilization system protein ParE
VKLRIVRHRKFKRDALQIFVYIGERNMDAAERFLQALDSDLKKLADMPGMGPAREFADPALDGIRSWPVSEFRDYLVFYRPTGDRLEALRVIHGARDLDRAMGQ